MVEHPNDRRAEFDPTSESFLQNPHAVYENFRAEQPVIRHGNQRWPLISFFRYRDVSNVFRHPELWSSNIPEMRELALGESEIVIQSDAQKHGAERSVISGLLSESQLTNIASVAKQIAEATLEGCLSKGVFDFQEDFAARIAIQSVAHLTGVPLKYCAKIRDWSNKLAEITGAEFVSTDENVLARQKAAVEKHHAELSQFYVDVIQNVSVKNGCWFNEIRAMRLPLSQEIGFFKLIVFAGNHTTTIQLTNSMYEALCREQLFNECCNDENGLRQFTTEVSRLRPVFRLMNRVATAEGEANGVRFVKGDNALLWIDSANRDERIFELPNDFCIDRASNRRHLGFGIGVHVCPGRFLAEKIILTTLKVLAEHESQLSLVNSPRVLMDPWINAFESMNVQRK